MSKFILLSLIISLSACGGSIENSFQCNKETIKQYKASTGIVEDDHLTYNSYFDVWFSVDAYNYLAYADAHGIMVADSYKQTLEWQMLQFDKNCE